MYVATAPAVRPLGQSQSFLGALAALRKATISFLVVFPSAWNNVAATGRIFVKSENCSQSVEKLYVSLAATLHEDNVRNLYILEYGNEKRFRQKL